MSAAPPASSAVPAWSPDEGALAHGYSKARGIADYSDWRVIRSCVCGGTVVAETDWVGDVIRAIGEHAETPEHVAWRFA